ncbi:hypothetical protein ACH9EU_15930 [Kocuria sp. M1R5S2]|uniref:hypothetical protein n=1 Tax=Kocuria rhizosphaerae TaxID=3376285 RepID=UPI0037A5F352
MPARRLTLAALLLLVPVPAVAQPVTETGPATAQQTPADSPDGDPGPDGPATGAPEDGQAPADPASPEIPAAQDGSTALPEQPSPPGESQDSRPATGSDAAESGNGAGGQSSGQAPEEATDPAVAGTADPRDPALHEGGATDDTGSAGTMPAPAHTPNGAPAAEEDGQVVPGTVDRVTLGALTRVPAEDSGETLVLPAAGWGLVVSALAAVTAAVLLLRRRRAARLNH